MKKFKSLLNGNVLEYGFQYGLLFEVVHTWHKRWFGRGFYKTVFHNVTSGWYMTTQKRFNNLIEASAWVKDVLQRIERGEL